MKWISGGKDILMLRYEDLRDFKLRNEAMTKICNFLKFTIDEKRLKCLNRHMNPLSNNKTCLMLQSKDRKLIQNNSFNISDIFHLGHKKRINQAIRRVNGAILQRFSVPLNILDYEKTKIEIKLCNI